MTRLRYSRADGRHWHEKIRYPSCATDQRCINIFRCAIQSSQRIVRSIYVQSSSINLLIYNVYRIFDVVPGSFKWQTRILFAGVYLSVHKRFARLPSLSLSLSLSLSFSLFSRLIVSDLSHAQSGLLSLFRFLLSLLCPFRVSKCYFQSY